MARNLYNDLTTSDEFSSDSSEEDDDDDDEDNLSFIKSRKRAKKQLTTSAHEECDKNDIDSKNILLRLFERERTGFLSKNNRRAFTKVPSRLNFCLKNIVPYCYLESHMFMGLTACGQFLISYKVCYDENSLATNNYNFNSCYKYSLYFWIYRPHQPLGKFFKTCLFDDHGVDYLKLVTMAQWNTNPRILIVHGASENENEDSYMTIVRVPKLGCLDCKKSMESDGSDGYSFFHCDVLCIKCNLTIHTKYSTTESDPKFNPYVNLLCPERIIIVANGFIHMLNVELEIPQSQQNHHHHHQQQQPQQYQNPTTIITKLSNVTELLISQLQKDNITVVDNNASAVNNQLNDKKLTNIKQNDNNGNNLTKAICDDKYSIVDRIIADFSEYENSADSQQSNGNCFNVEKIPSTFRMTDCNFSNTNIKSKNYDELIITCSTERENPSECIDNNVNETATTASVKTIASCSSENRTKVSLLNYKSGIGKRNHRIVTKSYRNGITTIDLQGDSNSNTGINNSPNTESLDKNDKASAYEFSEDNEKCEKIGLFRKRRLADKKYEFSEDNSENIVPFYKSRISNQANRNTRLYRTLTTPSHYPHHHHHYHNYPTFITASSSQTYETTTHHHRASPSQGFRSPCGSPVGSSRFMRSPSKNNPNSSAIQPSSSPSSQQQQQIQSVIKPLNTLSPRQISTTAIKPHFDSVPSNNSIVGSMSPTITPFLSPRRDSPFDNRSFEMSITSEDGQQEKPTCTKKLRRRYVEEDDATSVITSEEDDCIFPGYHTSLPMEVHGSCYSDMQMISQVSYQKLKCPSVVITQHSFDLETFTYHVISNLCQKNNKIYDVFYDWACEMVNVCPFSNSITCILMAHFTARDKLSDSSTKCLNCSKNIDCIYHRRRFECRILFTWNMEIGDWNVLDYGYLNEVPSLMTPHSNNKKSQQQLQTVGLSKIARNLANELSTNLNKMYNLSHNLRVLDSNIDKSKDSLNDIDNCIRFYRLKRARLSSIDTILPQSLC